MILTVAELAKTLISQPVVCLVQKAGNSIFNCLLDREAYIGNLEWELLIIPDL